jgi:CRISPR/Cas system-associated exonuclease Cas4 (RecB family)
MTLPGHRRLVRAPDGKTRVAEASRWLADRGSAAELVIVGATAEAGAEIARAAGRALGGTFGWHRFTLAQLAWLLAAPALAERRLVPVGPLALEAVAVRLVHGALASGALGRFASIGERPGLPRALARTFSELRLARVTSERLEDRALGWLLDEYGRSLAHAGLADRADLFAAATAVARGDHPLVGKPLLLVDVPVVTEAEHELVSAVAARAEHLLVTVPTGDDVSARFLTRIEGVAVVDVQPDERSALGRLQSGLFVAAVAPSSVRAPTDGVLVFSSPGESRECVEIARMIQQEAAAGTPFDRMAVVLRSPQHYRAHVEEALRRAGVPATFARGTSRPDPSGRAFLALLASLAEGLSASRFAEYLSIGEVPDAGENGSPPTSSPDRWVAPDDDLARTERPEAAEPEVIADAKDGPVALGTLRAPRLWERMLVDAAVIGGLDRWRRRLDGLARQLQLSAREHEDPEDPTAARALQERRALEGLRTFALPLLEDLAALPAGAPWSDWLDKLGALATRALRDPSRVLAVLAELEPMADVGPVDLAEVRAVLGPRLTEVTKPPAGRRHGRVYVAAASDVRGMTFDVVFVPGLAEKLFPLRIAEDPVLPDAARAGTGLTVNADRRVMERLALRLAAGAATRRVVVSYPRLDLEQSRPRTPSFYGLEVLRAAEGTLPGFDELARRANVAAAAHVGWPAPVDPALAIDHREHDLALLKTLLGRPEAETVGMARYLLRSNVHLERALRSRAQRWLRKWTSADGLVAPAEEARAALAAHDLSARTYSPTGLQNYASCPYRFLLQAIHRLRPRAEPEPLEELDPLQRGSLIHTVQFELCLALRERALLPLTSANLEAAQSELEVVLARVVARYEDDLCPAIPRVWEDGVAGVRADVREWLRRVSLDGAWTPELFEYPFGPLGETSGRDPRSQDAPAALECGIRLRGSIDLVERRAGESRGALRATDYKTGKVRAKTGMVIGGGKTLQPVLYALALEQLLPGEHVASGRLYYCTTVGEFTEVVVPLDKHARDAARLLASTIHGAIEGAFLPAAPAAGECEYCEFLGVCGPNEEQRTHKKKRDLLVPLDTLRREP